MDASKGKRKHRGYLPWAEDMDQILLDVLLKHYQNDDYTPTGWKSNVYTAAINGVREKCNVEITKDHVLSRCKTFDKHCNIVNKILAHSEFGWNQKTNRLIIHCEDAWERFIEKNKAAACYRNKVIKNWYEIDLLFSRDHGTSEDVSTGAEDAQETALKDAEDVHGSTRNSPSPSEHSSQYRGGPPPSTQEKQQCRRIKRFRANDALFCMSGTINNSFQISIKSNEPLDESRNACPKKIFAALQEIPNLGREDLLRAYCILTNSDRKFESLMALPMDMRKDWLWMEIGKK